MSSSFESPRSKIRWAYHYLEIIEREIRLFLNVDPYPYPILVDFNADRTECRCYITIEKTMPQTEWGLLIGDCVHNARSALDHLTWELAEGFSGHDPEDVDTQFPIFTRPSSFAGSQHRYIGRLPCYAQALIEMLQPYRRRDPLNDPLWLCRNLDNDDKHKVIMPIAAIVQSAVLSPSHSHPRVIEQHIRGGPFVDGAEIGFLRFASPAAPEMYVNTRAPIVIALRDRSPFDVDIGHVLRTILLRVTRIVDCLEQFPDHHGLLLSP